MRHTSTRPRRWYNGFCDGALVIIFTCSPEPPRRWVCLTTCGVDVKAAALKLVFLSGEVS